VKGRVPKEREVKEPCRLLCFQHWAPIVFAGAPGPAVCTVTCWFTMSWPSFGPVAVFGMEASPSREMM